jgi:hypothetical protein
MKIQILETGQMARSIAYEARLTCSQGCEVISMYGTSALDARLKAMDELEKLHKEMSEFLAIENLTEASK